MKRLFIEVQYDEEVGEATDVLMDKACGSLSTRWSDMMFMTTYHACVPRRLTTSTRGHGSK